MKSSLASRRPWRSWQKAFAFSILGSIGLASSAQAAWNIDPNALPTVRRLVFQIKVDSQQASQEAQRYADWRNASEQQGLRALGQLVESSDQLDNDVERSWVDPSQVDYDYGRVDRAFAELQTVLPYLRAYAYDRPLFDRLRGSVDQLRMIHASVAPGFQRELQSVSRSLVANAQDLVSRAQAEVRWGDGFKEQAVRDARTLLAQAQQLLQATSNSVDGRSARSELEDVRVAFQTAQSTVLRAGFSTWVIQELSQAEANVRQLERLLYGGAVRPVPPPVPVPVPVPPRPIPPGPGPVNPGPFPPRPPVVMPPAVPVPGGGPQGPRPPHGATPVVVVPGGGPQGPIRP